MAHDAPWQQEALARQRKERDAAEPALGKLTILKIKPNMWKFFEQAIDDLASEIRSKEPGCLQYQLARNPEDELEYTIIEQYSSLEALKSHKTQAHVVEGNKKLAKFVSAQPQVKMFATVGKSKL
eukprot:TRINITY_DN13657_c0_g1_i1.p1 TRINITY_DN13657_c0_g1~~TRINITY_DN13657_c0_g1_i1.p1  ORF type:complete len:142 (+),score=31.42 TRINITY_DN13657_c0_g1_i1:52-426(+)